MDDIPPTTINLKKKILRAEQTTARFLERHVRFLGILFAMVLVVGAWTYFGVLKPPAFFPVRTVITVPEGATLTEIADMLRDEQVVHYSIVFTLFTTAKGGANSLQAGDYFFEKKLTLPEVIDRLLTGAYGLTPEKVTVPEGATTYEIADIFAKKFEKFDAAAFLTLASEKEGYLFPDTYQFLPNVTAPQVLDVLERTFYEKLSTLENDIARFGRPIHEVITMASLLEKEANEYEQKRIISGVLWKRLEIGMPLQVDAVFGFIERTGTFSPNYSDLTVESPYNTYKNGGLPPGPIGNPGLDSIKAAVFPEETDALFYLHGRDGNLYASHTYEEHLRKKRIYLD